MATRYNQFENSTNDVLFSLIKFQLEYRKGNTTDVLEERKNYLSSHFLNKIFYDAESPYLTDYGNHRRTEFVIHCPKYRINWRIECKRLTKLTDLKHAVLYQVECVADLNEDMLILILDGDLLLPEFALQLAERIKLMKLSPDRIWFGSLAEFEIMLKQHIKINRM